MPTQSDLPSLTLKEACLNHRLIRTNPTFTARVRELLGITIQSIEQYLVEKSGESKKTLSPRAMKFATTDYVLQCLRKALNDRAAAGGVLPEEGQEFNYSLFPRAGTDPRFFFGILPQGRYRTGKSADDKNPNGKYDPLIAKDFIRVVFGDERE